MQKDLTLQASHSERRPYQKPECFLMKFKTENILQISGGDTQVTTDYDENAW